MLANTVIEDVVSVHELSPADVNAVAG
jgi:hypothetical protein